MKKNNKIFLAFCTLTLTLLAGCTRDADKPMPPSVIKGIDTEYFLILKEKLTLKPVIENSVDSTVWLLDGRRVATTPEYTFQAPATPCTCHLLFRVYNADNIVQQSITIEIGKYIVFKAEPFTAIRLKPSLRLSDKKNIRWKIFKAPSPTYRLSDTTERNPVFISDAGTYKFRVESGDIADTVIVVVRSKKIGSYTPYIAKVFDYMPAPGQFVNEIPSYVHGDTRETMAVKALKEISGPDPYMITLGGWGGSVTFGFDHTIVNVEGKCDFRVLGNMFIAAELKPGSPIGGSAEPAIIMVAYDKNKNGKPDDDEWYEINGSGNFTAEKERWYNEAKKRGVDVRTFRDYEVTYYKPKSEEIDSGYSGGEILIKKYLRWSDNKGVKDSFFVKNQWHKHPYYPEWMGDSITFKGIRLAVNGYNMGTKEKRYYVQFAFHFGYADNMPNGMNHSAIDIDWAIDKNGKPANLPGIDFVKVYTGVHFVFGWLGESSPEIAGANDLHMMGIDIDSKKVKDEYPIK